MKKDFPKCFKIVFLKNENIFFCIRKYINGRNEGSPSPRRLGKMIFFTCYSLLPLTSSIE
ncbi:MAG: hypothetical protein EGQ21_06345 [Akkermansia sp.]|nr:hypothetical protein [Akkermansia sp.]